jgi:hypothetical protein
LSACRATALARPANELDLSTAAELTEANAVFGPTQIYLKLLPEMNEENGEGAGVAVPEGAKV